MTGAPEEEEARDEDDEEERDEGMTTSDGIIGPIIGPLIREGVGVQYGGGGDVPLAPCR